MRPVAVLAAFIVALGMGTHTNAQPKDAAFFGLLFINTTLAPTTEAEEVRVAKAEARLRAGLEASGGFRMIDITPVANEMNLYSNLSN
ncbi:MAG: DUF2380 domain-containing protein, partial [Pseudomonadota bacterium]